MIDTGTYALCKQYTDEVSENFGDSIVLKGEVDYFDDLPTSGQEIGDSYIVKYKGTSGTIVSGDRYVWGKVGSSNDWIQLGAKITDVNGNLYLGTNNEAEGAMDSFILGSSNELTEGVALQGIEENVIFGNNNTAGGERTFTTGKENSNLGNNSAIFGCFNRNEGKNTIVAGYENKNLLEGDIDSSNNTFIAGSYNVSRGIGNFVAGRENTVVGDKNLVAGEGNEVFGNTKAVFGKYAVDAQNVIFAVGHGSTSTNRQNAFEILNDGNIHVSGDIKKYTHTRTNQVDLTSSITATGSNAGANRLVSNKNLSDISGRNGIALKISGVAPGGVIIPTQWVFGKIVSITERTYGGCSVDFSSPDLTFSENPWDNVTSNWVNYIQECIIYVETESIDELFQKVAPIKSTLDEILNVNTRYFITADSLEASITLPDSDIPIGAEIQVVLYSGSTPTVITVSGSIVGDVPVPEANQRIEMNFLYDGRYWSIFSKTDSLPGGNA